jgi:uracil-DNA glycosylase family 4
MKFSNTEKAMLSEMGIYWPSHEPILPSPEVRPAKASKSTQLGISAAPAVTPNPPQKKITISAQNIQVNSSGWNELQSRIQSCSSCELAHSRQQAISGIGHYPADCFILGEIPSEQDDQQGTLGSGEAGNLLKAMMHSVGLTLGEGGTGKPVFFSSAVKCKPPRQRNPQANELEACRPFLVRQIELVKPKVILAMGRLAAQQLLGTEKALGALRGHIHDHQGIPVIVSYSAAYLLRHCADKAGAWEDWCRLKKLLPNS